MFHYMNEKEVTFNVKYEIVLYTPVFNARWGGGGGGWNRYLGNAQIEVTLISVGLPLMRHHGPKSLINE